MKSNKEELKTIPIRIFIEQRGRMFQQGGKLERNECIIRMEIGYDGMTPLAFQEVRLDHYDITGLGLDETTFEYIRRMKTQLLEAAKKELNDPNKVKRFG